MAKDSARNDDLGCLYGLTEDGRVTEWPITRRTPKRVYFRWHDLEMYVDRTKLERDGSVYHGNPGWNADMGTTLYAQRPTGKAVMPVPGPPASGSDSARNDEGDAVGRLWEKLHRADWSSNAAAYKTAADARQIIAMTGMTHAAFAAECKARHISGFGSQASVSRRLRWAELHDQLWEAGILPRDVFISEAASRPLFDGKLTAVQRLKLLAELFGQYLTDEARQRAAEALNEALMREHLKRHGQGEGQYTAPRVLNPEKVIARLLAQGMTAGQISEIAQRQEDSARNHAAGPA